MARRDAVSNATIESATYLTQEQKRDSLHRNAARFPKLSDEENARRHGK